MRIRSPLFIIISVASENIWGNCWILAQFIEPNKWMCRLIYQDSTLILRCENVNKL